MAGPKYTSYEKISRKLRGRLKLGDGFPEDSEINNTLNALVAYNPAASDQVVDLRLLDDIAETQESYIDLLVSQIYQFPLRLTEETTINILRNISEGLILSSLLSVHFQGVNPGVIASDSSSASIDWRRGSEFLLAQILAGMGIFFPSSIQSPNSQINTPEMQPLRLPGEVLLGQSQRPDTITRNYSFFNRRNTQSGQGFFNDRDCACQPRSDGTALGSQPRCYDIDTNSYPNYEKFD